MNKIVVVVFGFLLTALVHGDGNETTGQARPTELKPVASTGSGILLQPPIDLSQFTRENFEAYSSTVGKDKIRRAWTSAITPLPPLRPVGEARPLSEAEVKETMLQIRDLFEAGKAAPVSDVGLISTHEDVNRKPMYNHVSAFANPTANAYLLVQRLAGTDHWEYFAIVQDLETEPPTDYFADIEGRNIKFEGKYCYKCHSSGPLAVHPAREDLVSDVPLLTAINRHIAGQPASRMRLPGNEKPDHHGAPLKHAACVRCHDEDADRGPLFRTHSYPIRMLVDFGYMPPDRRLKPEELADLKSWLEAKP
jgi:hypothetical protein